MGNVEGLRENEPALPQTVLVPLGKRRCPARFFGSEALLESFDPSLDPEALDGEALDGLKRVPRIAPHTDILYMSCMGDSRGLPQYRIAKRTQFVLDAGLQNEPIGPYEPRCETNPRHANSFVAEHLCLLGSLPGARRRRDGHNYL